MVKFGKNKFKAINKLERRQKQATTSGISNKILKKKITADKKVTFQKEVLLNETLVGVDALVKNVTRRDIIPKIVKEAAEKKKQVKAVEQTEKPKQKAVEKHKKRHKTQLNDTKLLLSLMKKK